MELNELLKNIFHSENFTIEKTNKGFTNRNYIVTVENKKYMVRVPWEHSEHVVNHQHEEKTMQVIQSLDLDVPLVYYDVNSGIKITEFIEDLWEFEECPFPDKITRAAILMKRLHQANLQIGEDFLPIKRLAQYQRHITNPLYDLKKYDYVIQQVENLHNPHVLCHNDWVSGNVLFSNSKDYLIDYEYGADNDPLFDVMSFISENNIYDTEARETFYHAYFDEITPLIREQLSLWEDFHNLLWCTWAMMMWEQRHEDIYKDIAQTKYQALCNSSLHDK